VVESVFENMEVKKNLYAQLDQILPPEIIIATNTSSLSITEIAAITKGQTRSSACISSILPTLWL
jgi:3-hydroxybutyryl-CoA dehydrogenase